MKNTATMAIVMAMSLFSLFAQAAEQKFPPMPPDCCAVTHMRNVSC